MLLLWYFPQMTGNKVDFIGDFGVNELFTSEFSDHGKVLPIKNKPILLSLIDKPLQQLLNILNFTPIQLVLALI